MLSIEQISCDFVVQPRERLNRSAVREYLELMRADEHYFPPLHVVAADGKFLLVDGYHRLEAAKLAKLKTVRCSVHAGDRRRAILLSSSANVRNGLTRRRFPVGVRPTRQPLQPEAAGAVMEVTKWLKPSDSVSRIGDSASVQAATRVNAEQASKRTMRRPTRRPFRGRLIRLGE